MNARKKRSSELQMSNGFKVLKLAKHSCKTFKNVYKRQKQTFDLTFKM